MTENKAQKLVITDNIQSKIYSIRGMQVMLDADLAGLYGVKTKALNQAVKRNDRRFPAEFMFLLSREEWVSLRSQFVTLETRVGQHRKYLPFAFTEQGVSMLSAVLRSKTAIEMSTKIINSFVKMRRFIILNEQVFSRLERLEDFKNVSSKKLEKILSALEDKSLTPKQGIFYNGQMFDAHLFISNLIKKAQKSIILLDNYVDESVLQLFSKRSKGVSVTIYTKNITKDLELDLKKFNSQYDLIDIKLFSQAHDRFLIIDQKDIYHLGASLKDLGKKWFAFSKMNIKAGEVISKLREK